MDADARQKKRREMLESAQLVMAELERAAKLLENTVYELKAGASLLHEAYAVGSWSKSDDSSDNRNKRQLLRDAEWKVSYAARDLADLGIRTSDLTAKLTSVKREIEAIEKFLVPLPDRIKDWSGDDMAVDCDISSGYTQLEELAERLTTCAARWRLQVERRAQWFRAYEQRPRL